MLTSLKVSIALMVPHIDLCAPYDQAMKHQPIGRKEPIDQGLKERKRRLGDLGPLHLARREVRSVQSPPMSGEVAPPLVGHPQTTESFQSRAMEATLITKDGEVALRIIPSRPTL
jgi:hypothetical protein